MGQSTWPLTAKLFGVQARGQKAAQLQLIYMVFAAIVGGVQLLLMLIGGLLRGAIALGQWVGDNVHALPRWWRNARLCRQRRRIDEAVEQAINRWDADRLSAAFALAVAVWGRGEALQDGQRTHRRVSEKAGWVALPRSPEVFAEAAQGLEHCRAAVQPKEDAHRILIALLAEVAAEKLEGSRRAALLFEADDLALIQGPRTVLQEQMLEIFADHAQLQIEPARPVDEATKPSSARSARGAPGAGQGDEPTGRIDLNTASIEELQAIPHIGPERAEAIVALRPIRRIEQLEEVDGIGTSRLAEIADQVKV